MTVFLFSRKYFYVHFLIPVTDFMMVGMGTLFFITRDGEISIHINANNSQK